MGDILPSPFNFFSQKKIITALKEQGETGVIRNTEEDGVKANARVQVQIKFAIQNENFRLMTAAMQVTLKSSPSTDIWIVKMIGLHSILFINYSKTVILEIKPSYKYCEMKKVFDYICAQNEADLEPQVSALCTKIRQCCLPHLRSQPCRPQDAPPVSHCRSPAALSSQACCSG